jgi:hypothetical protein
MVPSLSNTIQRGSLRRALASAAVAGALAAAPWPAPALALLHAELQRASALLCAPDDSARLLSPMGLPAATGLLRTASAYALVGPASPAAITVPGLRPLLRPITRCPLHTALACAASVERCLTSACMVPKPLIGPAKGTADVGSRTTKRSAQMRIRVAVCESCTVSMPEVGQSFDNPAVVDMAAHAVMRHAL